MIRKFTSVAGINFYINSKGRLVATNGEPSDRPPDNYDNDDVQWAGPVVLDERYISAVVPQGCETTVGYLARHYRLILDGMDEHPDAILRDELNIRGLCLKGNIKPTKVCLPPVYKGFDIQDYFAYPNELLGQYFRTRLGAPDDDHDTDDDDAD